MSYLPASYTRLFLDHVKTPWSHAMSCLRAQGRLGQRHRSWWVKPQWSSTHLLLPSPAPWCIGRQLAAS